MQTGAQRQTAELDAALTAALEAAAGRVNGLVQGAILAARLATAVHMRRVAESDAALGGHDRTSRCLSRPAAPTDPDAAARLMRQGGRP